MSTQTDIAKRRLFGDDGLHASNFKLFPGTSREKTPQQIAEQVNKIVTQLEEGDFEEVQSED
ncbi:MAG TPA: hypothetical protein VNW53_11660 [Phenylobacterium sp.]|jgi:hypothetical protein|uniref:hypothetical protein n=1 Tax=Phenylobacterium sp. TaxID=1871053 RepID=UPI002CA033D2|nr:hypothetical protein [Phenylobacterium sp.]HXA39649.1 hypothetical protein [Phenylobacterium sp.]